ncbi:MAG: carboxypeptidase regulatory-like domain-containing protein [Spirochaetes bacterium]|nr:carboxypeptidase regulatory-like domain-containing protein [Spirochaetota bacterium]
MIGSFFRLRPGRAASWLLFFLGSAFAETAPILEPGLVESDDPRIELRAGVASNRSYAWTTGRSGPLPALFLSERRGMCSGGNLVSSGFGYGQDFPTNLAAKPVLRLSFSRMRSVSALLLMHEEGQTARAVLRGPGGEWATNLETYAPSVLQYARGGVVGQVREFLIANELDPEKTYTLELTNLGFCPRAATNAWAWRTSSAEGGRGRGPQLLVDGVRLGTFPFSTLEGQVRLPTGAGVPQAKLTLDNGAVFYTDGFGRFSRSGLRARSYNLAVNAWPDLDLALRLGLEEGDCLSNDLVLPPVFSVIRPRTSMPAIVDTLGTIAIEVEGPEDAQDFEVRLMNREKAIPLPMVTRPVFGQNGILHETRAGWTLQAPLRKLRPPVPADLWDLEITAVVGGAKRVVRQARAVKVLTSFSEPFYIVHVGELRSGTPQAEAMAAEALEVASLAGGRALVVGGGLLPWAGLRQDLEHLAPILGAADQALLAIPGDSDTTPQSNAVLWSHAQSHEQWLRWVGPWFHDLRMSGVYFLFHDSQSDPGRVTLPLWKRSQRDARDDLRILFSHRDAWKPLSNEAPPRPSLFVGNVPPMDGLRSNQNYPYVSTMSPALGWPVGGRLLRFSLELDHRWRLGAPGYLGSPEDPPIFWRDPALLPPDGVSIATRRGADDDPDPRWVARRPAHAPESPASLPLSHFAGGPEDAVERRLTRSWILPNDGTQTSNTVVFTNRLGEVFDDARARFVLARGNYRVEGPATFLSAYDSDDLTRTVFHVRVKVGAHGATSVTVRPL